MKALLTLILVLVSTTVEAQLSELEKHRLLYTNNHQSEEGIKFICPVSQLLMIDAQMSTYLKQLDIPEQVVQRRLNRETGTLLWTLATPSTDTSTLNFYVRPELAIQDQEILLPLANGKYRKVSTVSEKEIVLALMQHGRLTEFSGEQCQVEAVLDHVRVRQNTVAWAEQLAWVWPDGGKAQWNKKYWNEGTPLPGVSPSVAIADAFLNQSKYAIGCYTATKLVMLQGVLDYYKRIKQSPQQTAQIERRLMRDGEPLARIEPRALWALEHDFDMNELWDQGKLLEMRYNIPPQNFVPGDWVFIANTDPKTQHKTGYEGSNAIYLGRGKFDDYYNDHHHSYTFHEKLNEVFQWRHGVFNRVRDKDKAVPLTEKEMNALEATPEQGGLVLDVRVFFM